MIHQPSGNVFNEDDKEEISRIFYCLLRSNKARGVAVATVTDLSALVHSFVFNNKKLGSLSVCVCMHECLCTSIPLYIRFVTFIVMAYAHTDPFKD